MKEQTGSKFSEMLADPMRFQKSMEIVKDALTDLDWLKPSNEPMTYKQAEEYCKKQGGRLPTVQELFSLVDHTKKVICINQEVFPGTRDSYYWSSTPVAWHDNKVRYVVGFGLGNVVIIYEDNDFYVRPCRASQ